MYDSPWKTRCNIFDMRDNCENNFQETKKTYIIWENQIKEVDDNILF